MTALRGLLPAGRLHQLRAALRADVESGLELRLCAAGVVHALTIEHAKRRFNPQFSVAMRRKPQYRVGAPPIRPDPIASRRPLPWVDARKHRSPRDRRRPDHRPGRLRAEAAAGAGPLARARASASSAARVSGDDDDDEDEVTTGDPRRQTSSRSRREGRAGRAQAPLRAARMARRVRPVSHEDRLTLVEHLDELRSRIVVCVARLRRRPGALLLAEPPAAGDRLRSAARAITSSCSPSASPSPSRRR